MTLQVVLAIAVFVGAYVCIVVDRFPRAAVVLVAAALMVLIGATGGETMFYSGETGIDWNVVFLLLGMMIIVGIVRHTGVFEFLAIWAAKLMRGRPFRVMVMLVVITAVLSAFLDNVTTVLLIAPVTLLVCERLGAPPTAFLIAEVMASNIGGTATLIGDPPNIIIASRGGLSFNDFLVHLAPISVGLLIVFVVLCRLMFRSAFVFHPERAARVMALDERAAITDSRLLVKSGVVVGLVIAGFLVQSLLHVEPSVVALLGAGLLALLSRLEPREYFREVEWETLVFFAGLFVMVGALVNLGVIDALGTAAVDLVGDDYGPAAAGLAVGSGALSAVVDNIPFVTTMSPLVGDLVAAGGAAARPLWWALALGADLGGNATAIGASANVVMIGIAMRNGVHISFWTFTKYGLVTTAVTVGLSVPYILLRYYS
ncbi:ArsB/NhaD family transporter [Nakamurella endophytica]|uniref:Membrane protein n=1 Tax=Nakamurella endophytica TaxID=1748367 RepID=A0A917SP40_9ACTN|nr:ArsB/NhaD family transporter [Nakamurella endophytica]GGL90138.1 membrane protein [Nakamurella endophytica]